MENEIDYKKLESCMIELFGDPSWSMYNRESLLQAKYVTTNGLVISSPNERFIKFGRNGVDKKVCLALELGTVENDPMGGYHMALIKWVIGLYVTKYVIKQSDSSKFKYSESCRIKNIILDPLWKEEDKTVPVWYLNNLKLTRIRIIFSNSFHIGYGPRKGNNTPSLNIESHHPLTSSQRRFLLDVIEGLNIDPDNILIDDYSESAQRKKNDPKLRWPLGNTGGLCIKRQLGLHFFK